MDVLASVATGRRLSPTIEKPLDVRLRNPAQKCRDASPHYYRRRPYELGRLSLFSLR